MLKKRTHRGGGFIGRRKELIEEREKEREKKEKMKKKREGLSFFGLLEITRGK